jgi:GWxTD domain-containing protein
MAGLALVLVVIGFNLFNCGGAKKVKLDVASEEFYEYARLIMTREEEEIFKHLPDKESRQEFIKDFWAKRDPDPDTEENEYKDEFFRRIEYANDRFNEGVPGWKTDRGRIYIYLGAPDKIDFTLLHGNPNIKGPIMWWIYYRYGVGILFVDKDGYGRFAFDPYSGVYGDLFGAIEMAKLGFTFIGENPTRKFVDFSLKYEHRQRLLVVSLNPEDISFRQNEEGRLEADFDFTFYIYPEKNTRKETKTDHRKLILSESELEKMKMITFNFDFALPKGKYYFDVIIIGQPDNWKTRKIFEIKIK